MQVLPLLHLCIEEQFVLGMVKHIECFVQSLVVMQLIKMLTHRPTDKTHANWLRE